jgi:hypothetical protein
MPFDSTPIFDPLTFSPGREGLRKLAYVLRHKKLWPRGHKWDYDCHGRCAMGIAFSLWRDQMGIGPTRIIANTHDMAAAFGIPQDKSESLFLYQKSGASPAHIATAIEKFLAS